jgi:DNA-binding Lrp family transcriptional regulator
VLAEGLDDIDLRILDLLVEDARRSASEIGRSVNLSPAAAKRRIDRLETRDYIRGYTAVLNHRKLDGQLEAFAELRRSSSHSPSPATPTRSCDCASPTSSISSG